MLCRVCVVFRLCSCCLRVVLRSRSSRVSVVQCSCRVPRVVFMPCSCCIHAVFVFMSCSCRVHIVPYLCCTRVAFVSCYGHVHVVFAFRCYVLLVFVFCCVRVVFVFMSCSSGVRVLFVPSCCDRVVFRQVVFVSF